jgi:hypothetical protein
LYILTEQRISRLKFFTIYKLILAGLYIENENDANNWVDFRCENLPMFCFECGLIGNTEEECYKRKEQPEPGRDQPYGALDEINI